MRQRVEARDVPLALAAKRMGLTPDAFRVALPNLEARGFPAADPDTGNFDLVAIDRWCDLRHHHLVPNAVPMGPRNAGDVVGDRLASLRAGVNGRKDRASLQG
jgi:hypothetical protein